MTFFSPKSIFILAAFFLCPFTVLAGLFYEHKYIGDQAFIRFVQVNHLEAFLKNDMKLRQFGLDVPIPYLKNQEVAGYYKNMFGFPAEPGKAFSFGDFCGLAGDHSIDAEQLFQGLFKKKLFGKLCADSALFSNLEAEMIRALGCHIKGIEAGKREGSFFSLSYIKLAAEDNSHFHKPPQNFEQMLGELDTGMLQLAFDMYTTKCYADTISKTKRKQFNYRLTHVSNASKYAMLHLLAMRFMLNAAMSVNDATTEKVAKHIEIAFMFEAFASHFLQDAFAAGHLSVQRSWRGLDNKGVHDYYNRIGLSVANMQGDLFYIHGDDDYTHGQFQKAIEANLLSLQELWDYFDIMSQQIKDDDNFSALSLYDSLRQNKIEQSLWPSTIIKRFAAYNLMPAPLLPAQYSNNELKSGSKMGMYIGLGYGRFTENFGNKGNGIASFTFGILPPLPFFLIKPKADSVKLKNIESCFWAGLALGASYVRQNGLSKWQYLFKTPLSFYDKFIVEPGIGSSVYMRRGHFMWSLSLGYEWKMIRHFWAPSLHYFIQNDKGPSVAHGIKLNINLY